MLSSHISPWINGKLLLRIIALLWIEMGDLNLNKIPTRCFHFYKCKLSFRMLFTFHFIRYVSEFWDFTDIVKKNVFIAQEMSYHYQVGKRPRIQMLNCIFKKTEPFIVSRSHFTNDAHLISSSKQSACSFVISRRIEQVSNKSLSSDFMEVSSTCSWKKAR